MSMGTTDKPTYRQKIRGWRALKRERQHGGGGVGWRSSDSYSSQKVAATQGSTDERMGKQSVGEAYNGILFRLT